MVRLLHITTGLGLGGAEIALYRLLSKIDRRKFDLKVVSLTSFGVLAEKIAAMDIPVSVLGFQRTPPRSEDLRGLIHEVRGFDPDIVHTWLYPANFLGGIVATSFSKARVVWGIHHGNLDLVGYARSTILTAKMGAPLSRLIPSRIVYCSESARNAHQALGYAAEKTVVIPNGFDLERFRPEPEARGHLCADLGLDNGVLLIGSIARFHPQKDHANFVAAAKILSDRIQGVHFVLIGPGIGWDNRELSRWIMAAGLENQFHLLGVRSDLPQVVAGLDMVTLSSRTEGFPTVIGEAMCCGVPCVVTNVGDVAAMIGETGIVVPVSNPQALADGWRRMLELDRATRLHLGVLARRRIVERYSLAGAVAAHEDLYRWLLS